jgi:hypothetical protein
MLITFIFSIRESAFLLTILTKEPLLREEVTEHWHWLFLQQLHTCLGYKLFQTLIVEPNNSANPPPFSIPKNPLFRSGYPGLQESFGAVHGMFSERRVAETEQRTALRTGL